MQSRFGAYRLERSPNRLTIRRATRTQTLSGCVIAFVFFIASYALLFASVFMGRASLQTANLSLVLGAFGILAFLWPFGSFRKATMVLDRTENTIRSEAKTVAALDTVQQVVVLSREAVVDLGPGMLRREQRVVYAEGGQERVELAVIRDRSEANRLAEAIAEFIGVPIGFEQGGVVQVDYNED